MTSYFSLSKLLRLADSSQLVGSSGSESERKSEFRLAVFAFRQQHPIMVQKLLLCADNFPDGMFSKSNLMAVGRSVGR